MTVTSNVNISAAASKIALQSREAIVNAAGDAMKDTTSMTPFKKGELRTKRRIVPNGQGALAQWFAQHAAVQNLGRRSGARPFSRYTTPGTGKGFVAKFTDSFIKALPRYFK